MTALDLGASVQNTRLQLSRPQLYTSQEIKQYVSYGEISDRVSIPSMQRSLDQKRVNEMKQHVLNRIRINLQPIFGCIDLVALDSDLYVIDGMHRLAALKQLYEIDSVSVPLHCIIYHVNSKEEMKEIFITRNKGVPVPDFIANCHDKKPLLQEIECWIRCLPGFRDSSRNRPYININHFMSALASSRLLNLVTNFEDFHKIFSAINHGNYQKYTNNPKARDEDKVTLNMLKKCEEWGNWIGLDKNCIWFEDHYDISPFSRLLAPNTTTEPINFDTMLEEFFSL